jgi:hypothetical protein
VTTISEITTPLVDPADDRSQTRRNHFSMSLLAAASAIIVTCINVYALTYLNAAISDLQAIDEKLELLQAFEERIANRMDTMNIGVQNRLETLSGEVHGQFNRIDAKLGKVNAHANAKKEGTEQTEAPFSGMSDRSSDGDVELSPNLAYERVQSADGKVYYRKMD